MLLAWPSASEAAGPRIVDLGEHFIGTAINSDSVIVGYDPTATSQLALRWANGTVTSLQPLAAPRAYSVSSAQDINEKGDIVGRSSINSGLDSERATVWLGGGGPTGIAPAYSDETISMSEGIAINDSGLVAGRSSWKPSSYGEAAVGSAGGTFSLLPVPTSDYYSSPSDINNAGAVVGLAGSGLGALWLGGAYTGLSNFVPTAINDAGVIAGYLLLSGTGTPYVRAVDGTLTKVAESGIASRLGSYPRGITNAGDIPGYLTPAWGGPEAWVRHQGTVYLLDDLLPAGTTGWDILDVQAISERGEMVGTAEHNGKAVGYLLTPDYPGYRLHGSVTTTDDQPVPNVRIHVTGAKTVDVTTDGLGEYSIDLEEGEYTISSPDDSVAPKPLQAGCGATSCTVTISDADVRIDFQKGCRRALEMTGFAAVNGCFVQTSDTTYETTEPFRFNGIDAVPAGTVTVDTLRSKLTGTFGLKVGDDEIRKPEATEFEFSAGTLTYTLPPLFALSLKGVPISGTVSISTTAGASTLTLAGEIPKDLRAQLNPVLGWVASSTDLDGSYSGSLSVTTTNAKGPAGFGITLAPGDKLKIPLHVGKADDPNNPKGAITIKEIRGSYDADHNVWVFGGKVSFPAGKATPEVDGALTFSVMRVPQLPVPILVPIRVTAQGNGINFPLDPPVFFLQRVGLDLGLAGLGPTDPFTHSFNVGISLLKQGDAKLVNVGGATVPLVPSEIASLDGLLTYSDVDKNPLTLADATYSGDATMKIWDQEVAGGGATWYVGLGSVELHGKAGFKDPTGALVISGTASAWWDGQAKTAQLEGHGAVHIFDLVENDLDYVITTEAIAACAGDKSGTYGIVYEWKTHRERIGDCDLGSYRKDPPRAKGASTARAFRLRAGQGIIAMAVKGKAFRLKGPGVNVAGSLAGKAFKRGNVRVIPIAADDTTYVVLLSPKRGSYRLSGASSVRFAGKLPDPAVTGTLRGDGCQPTLAWRARKIAGQEIRIVDSAANGRISLAASKRASGKVKAGGAGAAVRRLEAQVFQGRSLRETFTLARYVPVAAAKPIATGNIRRASRRVQWDPVCGAVGYEVKVGGGKAKRVKSPSLPGRVRKGVRVTVTAIGKAGKGPATSARLR